MSAIDKLHVAKRIMIREFSQDLLLTELSEEHFRLKIVLDTKERLYVRYNDYEEYSYQAHFSPQIEDFIRFDNFDDRWPVLSRPHHFHRKNGNVEKSSMNGEPEHDIPLFCEVVRAMIAKED